MNKIRIPHLKFISDKPFKWLHKPISAGLTVMFLVFIRPKYVNDIGLYEHEKLHVVQFWKSFCTMGLFYQFSPKWRYKYEFAAYKRQLAFSVDKVRDATLFAGYIVKNYKLDSLHLNQTNVAMELLKE